MYKWILAIRYLVHRKITYLAILVVALCVFVVFVVMTVMNGLVGQFKEKTHRFVGDCVIATESLVGFPYYQEFLEILQTDPMVAAASPVITTYGLVALADRHDAVGLQIMGIDPLPHARTTGFADTLYFHRDRPVDAFLSQADPNTPGCILGVDLVLNRDSRGNYNFAWAPLRAMYDITCIPLTAKGALAKVGTGYVNTKRYPFADLAITGLAREDSGLVYLPLDQLQALVGMSGPPARVTAIHIKFNQGVELKIGIAHIAKLWQDFLKSCQNRDHAGLLDLTRVLDWKNYRRSTIAPMEKEEVAMAVLFVLVGITTVFIVFVVFYMLVANKVKDIGTLKAVGASSAGVLGLITIFAASIGLIGAAIGLVGGWYFLGRINNIETWLFDRFGFQLWDRTIFSIGQIPNQIDPSIAAIISICALAICLLGSGFPAIKAARMQPVETLRASPI